MTPKEIKIDSFEHFCETISFQQQAERERLYRGQQEDWKLYPKLVRYVIESHRTSEFYTIEDKMLIEFRSMASRITEYEDLELLAIAQHFDLPTRFLDWTTDSLIALWFAFEVEKNNDADRIVWGLVLDDFLYRNEKEITSHKNRSIKAYRPKALDPRLKAQRAWFTVQDVDFFTPQNSDDILPHSSEMCPLNEHEKYKYRLAKFLIPNNLRIDILKKLDSKGINKSTLFPDLKNICTRIENKFFNKHLLADLS